MSEVNFTRNTSDSGVTDTGLSSRGSSVDPYSRQTSATGEVSSNFFDRLMEETELSPIVEGDESVTPKVAAQGSSAAAAGPEESTKAQQNIDLAETLVELMQPFFVEILQCYQDGFKYISTTPYNTVLTDSEKYHDPIIGNLVDRIVCAAIPTFYPTELPNFDPYLASALIKHVLPRLQDFIYDGKCDVEKEPEMTEEEMRDMIDNIMPLTSVKESNFEQLCSNFLDVRREAVDKIIPVAEGYPTGLRKRNTPNYGDVGGGRQTKKYKKMRSRQTKKNRKNNKVYRGGQRWRVWYMGFLILIFGISLLCTLFYTMYELNLIKKQVDVSLQTQLIKKIFEIISAIQQGEKPSQSFSAITHNVTNPDTNSKALVSILPTRTVARFDDLKNYPLSLDSSEVDTIDQNFIDELQDNKDLFLQLQQISKAGPFELIYLFMSGEFAIDSFELLNKLTTDAAGFLLNGIETVESAKIKRDLVQLQKGFESFTEIDQLLVLRNFFDKCFAAEIGSSNIEDAQSLLYLADDYEKIYQLMRIKSSQKLMPSPKVFKDFIYNLVRTLEENDPNSNIVDETGVRGNQDKYEPSFFDKIPGISTIKNTFGTMKEEVKHAIVTKELADEKAQCFVRTMQGISTRKFAQLDGLKSGLKILQLDIGDIIGVEVVKNAFYFILPKGARLLSCYKAIVILTSLLTASITTYGIYRNQAAQGNEVAEVRAELADVQLKIANGEQVYEARLAELIQQLQRLLDASAREPGARGLLSIGNGNNSNSSSSASSSSASSSSSNPSNSNSNSNSDPQPGPPPGASSSSSGTGSGFQPNIRQMFPGAFTSNNSNLTGEKFTNYREPGLYDPDVSPPPTPNSSTTTNKKRDLSSGKSRGKKKGGRTRRRTRQTKKRRRPVRRRQTKKRRRNTKRRRM